MEVVLLQQVLVPAWKRMQHALIGRYTGLSLAKRSEIIAEEKADGLRTRGFKLCCHKTHPLN